MKPLTLSGLLVASLLTGCATTRTYQQTVSTWQDAKLQDLIGTWGYPDQVIHQKGDLVYVYHLEIHRAGAENVDMTHKKAADTVPLEHPGVQVKESSPASTALDATKPSKWLRELKLLSGQTVPESAYCDTRFTLHKHQVVKVSFSGNHCVSSQRFHALMGNPHAAPSAA